MFAIVKITGKQYKVEQDAVILVDKVEGTVGDQVTFSDVLVLEKDGKTMVGTPYVKGAQVVAKILSQEQGDKIDIRRYKSKVRHRRHIGFRAKITRLHINSVG